MWLLKHDKFCKYFQYYRLAWIKSKIVKTYHNFIIFSKLKIKNDDYFYTNAYDFYISSDVK